MAPPCTNCVRASDVSTGSGHRHVDASAEPGFEPAEPAAADRDRRAVRQLDRAAVARSLEAEHPDEAPGIEPRLYLPDGERAEELVTAVENMGVVRIGVDRDDVLDRHILGR